MHYFHPDENSRLKIDDRSASSSWASRRRRGRKQERLGERPSKCTRSLSHRPPPSHQPPRYSWVLEPSAREGVERGGCGAGGGGASFSSQARSESVCQGVSVRERAGGFLQAATRRVPHLRKHPKTSQAPTLRPPPGSKTGTAADQRSLATLPLS